MNEKSLDQFARCDSIAQCVPWWKSIKVSHFLIAIEMGRYNRSISFRLILPRSNFHWGWQCELTSSDSGHRRWVNRKTTRWDWREQGNTASQRTVVVQHALAWQVLGPYHTEGPWSVMFGRKLHHLSGLNRASVWFWIGLSAVPYTVPYGFWQYRNRTILQKSRLTMVQWRSRLSLFGLILYNAVTVIIFNCDITYIEKYTYGHARLALYALLIT